MGDAEELPGEDASFDVVTSNFGAMFAPRHDVVAHELARAVRRGGLVVMTAWTADGVNGRMFATIGRHLPAPPPDIGTPVQWGEAEHGRERLRAAGLEVDVEHDTVTASWPSVQAATEYLRRDLPPLVAFRGLLEADGRFDQAVADVCDHFLAASRPLADGFAVDARYLRYVARRPG